MPIVRREHYSRTYLPHKDIAGRYQFITWRLREAVPLEVIEAWQIELNRLADDDRKRELRIRIEKFCDAGHGSAILRNPAAARVVQGVLQFGHESGRFEAAAWSVMPNHVHILVLPLEDWTLAKIMKGIKSVSSRQLGKLLAISGQLWQEDYFDVWIRSPEHFERVHRYIEWNPVKAKLCDDPTWWPASSANLASWKFVTGEA